MSLRTEQELDKRILALLRMSMDFDYFEMYLRTGPAPDPYVLIKKVREALDSEIDRIQSWEHISSGVEETKTGMINFIPLQEREYD